MQSTIYTRAQRVDWALAGLLSLLIVAAASLPYGLAYRAAPEHAFTGVLLNPVDGSSYLAKMRQGWRGEWLFTLPYTAEPGAGVFLYSYYLFLGHLARWTGASLALVYHLARGAGGAAMLLAAFAFVGRLQAGRRGRWAAWLLFALGSGLGWLGVAFGAFTSDLWVAEAIPFLALATNPHFPLAIALLLLILLLALPLHGAPAAARGWRAALALAGATTLLAQVQPLALLSAGLVLGGVLAWRGLVERCWRWDDWRPALIFGGCAVPWLALDAWLLTSHPMLSAWSAQNQTPSPPAWDALLSGGVLLLLALPGAWLAARRRAPEDVILLVWLGLGVLAMYAPFALQRRLSLGLWMPLVLLAVLGLQQWVWPRLPKRLRPLAIASVALLALPSNLLVWAATLGAVAQRDPAVFLSRGEAGAMAWLAEHAAPGAVVVSAPELGQYVPVYSDARVLYGHPFETVDGAEREAEVRAFYTGQVDAAEFAATHQVRYVMVGPREQALGGGLAVPAGWRRVYAQDGVALYAP